MGPVTATRDKDNETVIKVEWTPPGNATIQTSYEVEYQEDNGEWLGAETEHPASPYTFNLAAGGSKYVFRVRAVTPLG